MSEPVRGARTGATACLPAALLALLLAAASTGAHAADTPVPADAQPVELAPIVVTADGSQVELPQPYAGGQVASGGRIGLFGNLDFMDTPFSSTNYTAELIRNQQSRSVGDVVLNDPAVRVARAFGNFQELYFIRGFPVFSDDMAYNGLYGLLPRQYIAAEFLERVEVFRGANSFLNGAAPGGSGIGGTINLVPKRAPDGGLDRYTLGYENDGHAYAAADVARRYGAKQQLGLRANAVRRQGETAIEHEDRELGALSLGADWRGERLRLSADLGWQDHDIQAPRPSVTPAGAIPSPPDSASNFAQPWTFTSERDLFGVVRGEYELGARSMIWLATGVRDSEERNVLSNPTADADGNTSAYRFDNTREDRVTTSEIGLRIEFATGAISHRLSTSASIFKLDSKNAYAFSDFGGFEGSLYEPDAVEPPPADFFVGGDMSDPLTTAESQTRSVALADTLSMFDRRLLLTLGLRHQTIEQTNYDYNSGDRLDGYDQSTVTPIAGVVVKPTRQVSLFANYAESLTPGETVPQDVGGTQPANAGEVFDPFKSKQVEAGVKLDREQYALTASLFRLVQPSTIFDGSAVVEDGEQRHQGIELSAFGEPLPGLRVLGGITLIDAELTRTEGGANDGKAPIGVPETMANVGVEWDIPALDGLSVDSRVIHTSSQAAAENNALSIPAWTRVDVGARYAWLLAGHGLSLRARVDNIAGRDYWASVGGFPGANYLVLGNPRTFTLSASVDF
jgi:iron complex outermembrane receptor protein